VAAPKPIGVQWLLIALAIACAVVYLLIRVLFAPHAPSPGEAITPGDTTSDLAAPAVADTGGTPAPELAPPPPASAGATESKSGTGAALQDATPKAPRRKATSKVDLPAAVPAEPPKPPPPEPAPAPRSSPPPVVEAPRDPWQAMNEGLSRCANEEWFKRGDCEQRLRLHYCPNHWGVVWQCPIGPVTDHGQ